MRSHVQERALHDSLSLDKVLSLNNLLKNVSFLQTYLSCNYLFIYV